MAEQFTAKFSVDISDLKKNIKEANKTIKEANAIFKSETAGMEKWSDNADGLSKKLTQLERVLGEQKKILAAYEEQLKRSQRGYEENGKQAEELKKKLQDLAANGVQKTDAEYQKYENALKEVIKEQAKNGKACEDLKAQILNQKAAVAQTEGEIRKYTAAQDKMEAESRSATSQVKKQQQELTDLKRKYADVVAAEGKNSASAKALAKDITKLSGELKENRTKLQEGEKQADKLDKSVDKLGKTADKTGKKTSEFGKKVASALKTAAKAAATAIAGAVSSMAASTVTASQFADQINTLSAVTGISTDELQSYSYAAELVDVSLETLTGSLRRNVRSMSQAASGSAAFADAYAALGIGVTDTDGKLRDSQDVFWEAINALGQIEDETERDAIAMQIFGKSAQDLNPLIEAGAERLAELRQQAYDAGAVMSGETLNALGGFNDSLERLKSGAEAAKNSIGQILLPVLSDLADEGVSLLGEFTNAVNEAGGDTDAVIENLSKMFPDVVKTILEKVGQAVEIAVKTFAVLIPELLTNLGQTVIDNGPALIRKIVEFIKGLADWLSENLSPLVRLAVEAIDVISKALLENTPALLQAVLQIILAVVTAITDNLPLIIESIIEQIPYILAALIDSLPIIIEGIVKLVAEIIKSLPRILKSLWNAISNVFSKDGNPIVIDALKRLGETIKTAFTNIINSDVVKKMIEIGANIINGLKEGIINTATKVVDAAKQVVGKVVDGVKKLLGIHSPSKVFEGIGENMALGMEEGFSENLSGIKGDIKQITSGLNAGVNYSGLTANGPLRGSAVSYTQIINAPMAPSRIDIYRQTQNLLALTGGA